MKCAFALLALLALVPFSSSASVGSKGEKSLIHNLTKFYTIMYIIDPLFILILSADKKVMVCYYGSWAVYRPEPGKFDVDQIDPL